MRVEVIEQNICDLSVVRLAGGQAEPDREPQKIITLTLPQDLTLDIEWRKNSMDDDDEEGKSA